MKNVRNKRGEAEKGKRGEGEKRKSGKEEKGKWEKRKSGEAVKRGKPTTCANCLKKCPDFHELVER